MRELDFLFGEDDFQEKMDHIVLPFLRINLIEGQFKSYDGAKLHYYYLQNPAEKAAVVISHGFCEFNGKYHELMYYFYQMGYSVFMLEHRGHGYSHRDCEDMSKVYIRDFEVYVDDMMEFYKQVVKSKSVSKKYYLYAHSMGGAIGTLFMEKYPEVFEKAVLSSPMMKLNFGSYPMAAVRVLLAMAKLFKWHKKYAPGQHGFDNVDVFETSSALSRARYDYVFKLRQVDEHYITYGSTYAWTIAGARVQKMIKSRAAEVQIPILLCQAGRDTLVEPEPQNEFARLSLHTDLVQFEESKHEIFNGTDEIRAEYYAKVFKFLGE